MRYLVSSVAFVLACGSGCSESERNVKTAMSAPMVADAAAPGGAMGYAPPGTPRTSSDFTTAKSTNPAMMDPNYRAPQDAAAPDANPPKSVPRKIVYTADVALVAEDFPKTADAIIAAIRKFGGFVADQDISGTAGVNRHGTWKARIPIDRFDSFLDDLVKLGELQRRQIHSQDVTEEFYDLDARIKNKKVEEGRLVKHLEESTGKLDQILSVEKEISRVREEVERMEGRIRLLANLTELTTVTISLDERTKYEPATAPSFLTRAERTFGGSVQGVTDFLEGGALLALSIIPWLPFWIVGGLVVLFVLRRVRRRLAGPPPVAQGPTPA